MSVIGNNILAGASGGAASYVIEKSCRFSRASESVLEWTPSADGNRKTWTCSFWTKRSGEMADYIAFLGSGFDSNNRDVWRCSIADQLNFQINASGASTCETNTTESRFRDPTAWMHIHLIWNSPDGTTADRVKMYVDNVLQEWTGGPSPAQNIDTWINSDKVQRVGSRTYPDVADAWYDGYLADFYFIDGLIKTPSDFAETNDDTGEWVPIKYAGAYGTNGYFLEFKDSGAMGADTSGNGNNFTPVNLGASDQMLDTPTNNYCTVNAESLFGGNVSEGDLLLSGGNDCLATFGVESGKWYWEIYQQANAATLHYGICAAWGNQDDAWLQANGSVIFAYGTTGGTTKTQAGDAFSNFTTTNNYTTWANGDVFSIALDLDSSPNSFTLRKNNGGTPEMVTTFDRDAAIYPVFPFFRMNTNAIVKINFGADSTFAGVYSPGGSNADANGQGEFKYAVPADHLAMCSANLPDPAIENPGTNFSVGQYTGTGAGGNAVTGIGFQPGMVWNKNLSTGRSWANWDSMRGVTKELQTDNSGAETTEPNGLTSFDSDGFTVGSNNDVNENANNLARFTWLGGGAGVANTDGTINSTVSVNSTAGFSMVQYTGNGSSSQTVGHGLSSTPTLIISKGYYGGSAGGLYWRVFPRYGTSSANDSLFLNLTNTENNNSNVFGTYPTSTVWTVGNDAGVNESGTSYIAYVFNPVEGYSRFSGFKGNNNNNGPFIYLGFRPAWFMWKRAIGSGGSDGGWMVKWDTYPAYNPAAAMVYQNDNAAAASSSDVDFLANGVKIRNTAMNGSSTEYFYMAFSRQPYKTANAR